MPRERKALKWIPLLSYNGILVFGAAKLVVTVMTEIGDKWTAIAVETSAETLTGFFESHGHAILGERFRSLAAAQRASAKYAAKWLAGKRAESGCKEIAP